MLNPLDFKQPLMLDIGAGGFSSDSKFTSVDKFTEADITADMWDIPLPDNCVDGIFCSNALEHISKFDVVPTLIEWYRILKPGGRLQILVPDLEWVCQWWLANQGDMGWSLDILFGHQMHDGEYHKTGFTVEIMKRHFENTGLNWFINKIEYYGGTYIVKVDPAIDLATIVQRQVLVEAAKI